MAGKKPSKLRPGLVDEWKATQAALRLKMIVAPLDPLPRYVAGADMAYSDDQATAYAVALVYDRVEQRVVEITHAVLPIDAPYIPTFLSFREGPAVIEAIGKLKHPFGAVCFDGQGYAHPRRCGLATHVGVMLDVPSVGVAKTRLLGTHDEPGDNAGDAAALIHREEQIGLVLRTQHRTRPLFISVGHRVDLQSARDLVSACCTRYRIPEPTRQADIEVAKLKRQLSTSV